MLGTECLPAPGYVLFLPRLISSLASLRRSTTSRYFSFRSSSSEVSSSWVSCYKIIVFFEKFYSLNIVVFWLLKFVRVLILIMLM